VAVGLLGPIRAHGHLAHREGHRLDAQKGPVRRGRASYDGRPFADMVVFNDSGQWWVRLAAQRFGPCSSKRQAIKAAIETAQLAERQGQTARVQVQTGPADFERVWPKLAKKDDAQEYFQNP
jgi:hypothetical protein